MVLKFIKVHAHNFACYEDVELTLTDMGYTVVSGKNNNSSDNAVSNGSGKSSIFNAICFAITGETTQGLSNNIENIYANPNDCWVELHFFADDDEFVIRRIKTPKSDLKIYINGEDRSGKGIRDSQQLLDSYLPDVTSQLLGSIIILGQGLPYRFTYKDPGARKQLLERLTKSDYMVQSVKEKLEARKDELKLQLRSYEDTDIANKTKTKMYLERLDVIKKDLDEYELDSSEGSIDDRISDIKQAILSYNDEIIKLQNDKEQLENKISILNENKANETVKNSNELSLELQMIDKNINDLYKVLVDKKSEVNSLNKEITKLEAVSDICPTCGQKIINVHKIDTKNLRDKLDLLKNELSNINNEYENKLNEKDKIILNNKTNLNVIINNIDIQLNDLKDLLNKNIKKISSTTKINQSLIKEELRLSGLQENYTKLINELNSTNEKIEELKSEKIIITNNIKDTNEHLSVVQSLITLAKREFRSVLLENIVRYIDKKAKEYSLEVFGAELISIKTDENYINVMFSNKYYEALSGGEKQKIDIIIQLALRDLLSNQLNIHSNILVMDEVLDFLDEKGADAILRLIQDYTTDIDSIFMISHRVEKLNISYDTILEVIKDSNNVSSIFIR